MAIAMLGIGIECFRVDEFLHGEMAFGWGQILADGEQVAMVTAEILHHVDHFFLLLPETDHETGLGDNRRASFLDPSQ